VAKLQMEPREPANFTYDAESQASPRGISLSCCVAAKRTLANTRHFSRGDSWTIVDNDERECIVRCFEDDSDMSTRFTVSYGIVHEIRKDLAGHGRIALHPYLAIRTSAEHFDVACSAKCGKTPGDVVHERAKVDPRVSRERIGAFFQSASEIQVFDERAHIHDVIDGRSDESLIAAFHIPGEMLDGQLH
jgi:hypothetical protein